MWALVLSNLGTSFDKKLVVYFTIGFPDAAYKSETLDIT
jgi:hypothetical protein